ncbi:hypothetical protein PRIPAC_79218 [Pristionchus pacificus]|uniref:NAD(P)H-hydrate epimerase n=1 Tax=Pristionchus pacificus TaxID=54126 RepID=A0A2A6BXZ9_PRIPA|nr:hypothetical protein PRIPAC_79218 [Pristionchus pacificus]|eukprot:PDM70758.1 hypothetical protein PRIPAC_44962 [Pristionchus pacificus]
MMQHHAHMFAALNATRQLRATSVFLAELVETSDSSTKIKKITERKVGRYPETTKAFVKAKFDEYAKCGAKLKADEAEIQMRADRFIEPNDLVTKSQLRNYINTLKLQLTKTAWRRQVEREEEEMDDEHFEVEVEPSEEDIFLTDNDFHHFFTDVHNPVYPNTPVPAGATEFD